MQEFFIKLGVSLLVGFITGVERQISSNFTKKDIGVRDFMIISMLGFLSTNILPYKQISFFFFLSFIVILGFLAFYFYNEKFSKDKVGGFTTFFAMPAVFVLSSLTGLSVPNWQIFVFIVLLILILKLKEEWEAFVETIQGRDVIDFMLFIVVLFIVTPLIPANLQWELGFYTLNALFVWKIVALLSVLSFFSHFFAKYSKGKRAIIFTSFLGGLVSSIGTIYLISRNASKSNLKFQDVYTVYLTAVLGALVRDVVIIRYLVSVEAFELMLLPYLLTIFGTLLILIFNIKRVEVKAFSFTERAMPLKTIRDFVVAFLIIILMSSLVNFYLPDSYFYLSSLLASMVSSSAAIVATGDLFSQGFVALDILGWSFVIIVLGSMCTRVFIMIRYFPRQTLQIFLPLALMALTMVGGLFLRIFGI